MAAEEDKKFDAVLGGFLVNEMRIRAGDLHCPESDTLAAYHERSLHPEEMNSWKEHIVGCARCQAILAELEATDSIPLQVTEGSEVLPEVAGSAVVAGKSIPSQQEALLAPPEKSRVTPILRRVRWQWLAPVGALAAAVILWVAWHESPSPLNAPAETKTAKLEPPPALSTPATHPVTRDDQQAVTSEELSHISKDKDQSAVGGAAAAKPAPEAKALKQLEKPASPGRVAHPEPQADKEAGARADAAVDSLSAANREQKQSPQDTKSGAAGAVSQTAEVQTLTANAQLQSKEAQQNLQAQQNQLNDQKVSGPNPSKRAEQSKKSKAESPSLEYRAAAAPPSAPPPAPPRPPAAFNDGAAALRRASVISQNLIAAPGGKTLWRIGPAGMIGFSKDGGVSWSPQVSNVSVELTAGFAPSEKVCWIVGKSGTVLLTTDAGAHWATIHSPLAEDLGGIHATDALHASIWNLANSKVFETSDGGLTWEPAAKQ